MYDLLHEIGWDPKGMMYPLLRKRFQSDDILPYKGWAPKGMVYSLIKDDHKGMICSLIKAELPKGWYVYSLIKNELPEEWSTPL